MMNTDHLPRPLSPAVDRALGVLTLLADHPEGLGLAEISRALDEAKSSLFTVLTTMEARGFVIKAPATKKYLLGPEVWHVGAAYAGNISVLSIFQMLAPDLVKETGETMQIAVLQGRFILYIGKQDGTQAVRLATRVGERLPAHCAGLGKALLSQFADEELDELYKGVQLERFTAHTITDIELLKQEMACTRRRGYAVDRQEVSLDLRCVAACVFDAAGATVAAVSISVPIMRMTDERESELGRRIQSFARQLSWRLGSGDEAG